MSGEVMVLGTPNPRQREFLACRKKYIAFGGARGGGKSWAVRRWYGYPKKRRQQAAV